MNTIAPGIRKAWHALLSWLDFLANLPSRLPRLDLWIIISITAYFLYTIYSHIYYHGFWGDENYALGLSMHSIPKIMDTIANGRDAPFYYILLHYWIKISG